MENFLWGAATVFAIIAVVAIILIKKIVSWF
jgi:hypothetical protein